MSQVLFNEIMFYVVAVMAIIASLIGLKACTNVGRLEAANERLKKMNEGQKEAIEKLQNKVWFLEDMNEKGA